MKTAQDQKPMPAALRSYYRDDQIPTRDRGNTLLYILVLLVIFSVLGITMVSLFTTSSTSSATPNDTRRALYMAESGTRFALTKLRKSGFSQSTVDELNTTTYSINNGGSFNFNVFGPWFDSASDQNLPSGGSLDLDVKAGEIPAFFTVPANSSVINVINFDYTGWSPSEPGGIAGVTVLAGQTSTTLDLTLNDAFVANANELICFAVAPDSDQSNLDEGGSLFVSLEAKDIFPERNGAININRNEYFYKELKVHPGNVELTKLSGLPVSTFPFDVLTTDYVILSPQNYLVIPTGQSGDVSQGGDLDAAMNIYNRGTPPPMSRAPDIDAEELTSNLSKVDDSNFIVVDTDADTVNIGGGKSGADFGAGWYEGNKSIGGSTDFCLTGACEFGLGVRAFFIVDYSTQGDGFTFALINSDNNDTTSVGGDIDMGELMAFAGDSRLVPSPNPIFDPDEFLDRKGEGLETPKIALEFDVEENSALSRLCADSSTANDNTRNDPPESLHVDVELGETAEDRDVLQFVYWGSQSVVMPCRPHGNVNTYDDNRHDTAAAGTDTWEFTTGDNVKSSPAIWIDGEGDELIRFGADDNKLYSLNPLERIADSSFPNSKEWAFVTGDKIKSSPAIGSDGTIYFGSDDKNFFALNSNGSFKWSYPTGDKVSSSPALDEANGMIYVGSDDKKVYAFNLAGTLIWSYQTGDKVKTQPAIGSDGRIYVGSDDKRLWAFNPADRLLDPTGAAPLTANEFAFLTGDKVSSSPAIGSDGTIYFGSDDDNVYALNPADRLAGALFPTANEWKFKTGGNVKGHPAIDPNDGIIYIGSDDDKLYAFNPDGTIQWAYKTKGNVKTRPAIDTDGTVYVGSDKNRVYAFRPTDRMADPTGADFPTANEWEFTADGNVQSSPVIASDAVYVGADGGKGEGKLYAIQSFAFPRNERGTFISYSGDMVVSDEFTEFPTLESKNDWLNQYDYAVRMEVMRSASKNAELNYEYTIRTWIRRCQNADCTDNNIENTYYQDTRTQYAWFPAPNSFIQQKIEMNPTEHAQFDRMLFGFTGSTGDAGPQSVLIKKFQLSFIRPNDPIVTDDSVNYPVP